MKKKKKRQQRQLVDRGCQQVVQGRGRGYDLVRAEKLMGTLGETGEIVKLAEKKRASREKIATEIACD
jgi:hypothetical protein